MLAVILSFLMSFAPVGLRQNSPLAFENRAPENLFMGKGEKTGRGYYDVVVTRQPAASVFIKLDYNNRPTKFSFDLHHRVSLDSGFALPAEITTTIEVLSGGTTSMGSFTISNTIHPGDKFDETIAKVSTAEVDRYVTPFGKKTITLNTIPGSQSLSIVGKSVVITRGTRLERRETPGARIATVSNFKFEENLPGTVLE